MHYWKISFARPLPPTAINDCHGLILAATRIAMIYGLTIFINVVVWLCAMQSHVRIHLFNLSSACHRYRDRVCVASWHTKWNMNASTLFILTTNSVFYAQLCLGREKKRALLGAHLHWQQIDHTVGHFALTLWHRLIWHRSTIVVDSTTPCVCLWVNCGSINYRCRLPLAMLANQTVSKGQLA